MDGAIGTTLLNLGFSYSDGLELIGVTNPKVIQNIYSEYYEAGARVFLTNTFQANSERMNSLGTDVTLDQLYRCALANARIVPGFTLVSIGPCDASILNHDLPRIIETCYAADGLLFETCTADFLNTLHPLLSNWRYAIPPLLSLTFENRDGIILQVGPEETMESVANRIVDLPLFACGVNCGKRMSVANICQVLEEFNKRLACPLFVRPNAGEPNTVGTHLEYPLTCEEFASAVSLFVAAGAKMIGGCCGITAKHIQAAASKNQFFDISNKRHL